MPTGLLLRWRLPRCMPMLWHAHVVGAVAKLLQHGLCNPAVMDACMAPPAQRLVRRPLAQRLPLAPPQPPPLASRVSLGYSPVPAPLLPLDGGFVAGCAPPALSARTWQPTNRAFVCSAAPAFGQPGLTAFGSTAFGGAAPAAGGFGAAGFGAAGARGTRSVAWRKTQEQDTSGSTGAKSGGQAWAGLRSPTWLWSCMWGWHAGSTPGGLQGVRCLQPASSAGAPGPLNL